MLKYIIFNYFNLVAMSSAGLATIATRKTSEIGGKNAQNLYGNHQIERPTY